MAAGLCPAQPDPAISAVPLASYAWPMWSASSSTLHRPPCLVSPSPRSGRHHILVVGFHGGELAGVGVPGLRGISEMLSAAYAVARWVEYVSGALALAALATITWRLLRGQHKRILGAVSTLVVAG